MTTLVFSDVHLEPTQQHGNKTQTFMRFLREIDPLQVGRAVVLGDLFDFWFEYRHVVFSGYFPVLRRLAELAEAGVELHLVCGNHDFWAGRFLEQDLQVQVHRDTWTLTQDGRRVLFVHGDGINPADRGYRVYKRIARATPVIWLFRQLHPDWAMALARKVSHGSRCLFAAEDLSCGSEVQPLRDFAGRTLMEGKADVVMCGHSHYPECMALPAGSGTGLYINTGDWLYHQSYVEWEGGQFRLMSYQGEVRHEIARYEAQCGVKQEQQK